MSINSTHPEYDALLADWIIMSDTHAGERAIKQQGALYLAPTVSMVSSGMGLNQDGFVAYQNYKMRARFPDSVSTAVKALVGLMHTKPPTIELPASMEPMRENATNLGESLEVLLGRINESQLITGRIGLLLDVPMGEGAGSLPYIATYQAQSILNWDDGMSDPSLVRKNLNLVVLDESGQQRGSDFQWHHVDKFRVLILGDLGTNEPAMQGTYQVAVVQGTGSEINAENLIIPSLGGRTLDFVPFTFINGSDVVTSPDHPPLLGLADLSLGIYRGEADYRQALFMQGQDTLVVTGVDDPDMSFNTGAGGVIIIPVEADAKYIGVESSGLSEMRLALENDKSEASQRSGSMIDDSSKAKQSGDALRIRVVSRTATLNQLAKTGAFGLQQCLRQVAVWIGANPDEVVVTANMDFVNDTLGGEELVKLVTSKSMGAPISNESIHTLMEEKGLTQMTLEEELAAIELEEPLGGSSAADDLPGDEDLDEFGEPIQKKPADADDDADDDNDEDEDQT
jgi:hypothetical protein